MKLHVLSPVEPPWSEVYTILQGMNLLQVHNILSDSSAYFQSYTTYRLNVCANNTGKSHIPHLPDLAIIVLFIVSAGSPPSNFNQC